MDRRDETKRLVTEINEMLEAEMSRLNDYSSAVQHGEHLRHLASLEEVEILRAIKRTLVPLQQEFMPGLIAMIVKHFERYGVHNIAELVTRESVLTWARIVVRISDYGKSIGMNGITEDDLAQEILAMSFTDTEIADEGVDVVVERGLMSADAIRAVVAERRRSVTALRSGAL